MPRKPNYKFERFERQRAKAEKKAARLRARAERKDALNKDNQAPDSADDGADESGGDSAVDGPSMKTNIDAD